MFLFPKTYRLASRPAQPPAEWVPRVLPSGVKLPGHEVDHLPPSSARVKNERSCTSTSPTCPHAKHRNNSAFAFT
jgi:hypothetical protein